MFPWHAIKIPQRNPDEPGSLYSCVSKIGAEQQVCSRSCTCGLAFFRLVKHFMWSFGIYDCVQY